MSRLYRIVENFRFVLFANTCFNDVLFDDLRTRSIIMWDHSSNFWLNVEIKIKDIFV